MKLILFLVGFLAFAAARPQLQQFVQNVGAKTIRYVNELTGTGYKFAIEQDDGQKKFEIGELVNEGKENESLAVKGYYSYVGDDGKTYEVGYTADENGFQPEGEHIPPAASVKRTKPLGISSGALASLAGR
ncbi:larval cuticle protein 65Ag1-like [Onthophagus taurus]|uniref:larval cuticle protein 65Ag1-like n=1 Tax=Onthophagus taurus TaxID=166361 RepID=UPI000C20FCB8|nr:larval cuticle protein 8-like [Onthophagus taurus]